MPCIGDIERVAAAVAGDDAFDLERQDIGERGGALEPLDVNLDRLELDPAEVADEVLADERRRAAGFASADGGKRGALDVVGAVVYHSRENPVPVGHDPARADYQREFKPVQLGIAKIPFVDAEHHHCRAVVVRRRLLRVGIDAGAEIIAVAALHILAAQRPFRFRHNGLLPAMCSSRLGRLVLFWIWRHAPTAAYDATRSMSHRGGASLHRPSPDLTRAVADRAGPAPSRTRIDT